LQLKWYLSHAFLFKRDPTLVFILFSVSNSMKPKKCQIIKKNCTVKKFLLTGEPPVRDGCHHDPALDYAVLPVESGGHR
jgi:hypothetical protein